jgi:hypothetical protein
MGASTVFYYYYFFNVAHGCYGDIVQHATSFIYLFYFSYLKNFTHAKFFGSELPKGLALGSLSMTFCWTFAA